MKFSADLRGLDRAKKFFDKRVAAARKASAKALTKTAKGVRYDVYEEMKRVIAGGPTPYTLRSLAVDDATEAKLEARVYLRIDSPSKGSVWNRALGHLFRGGARDVKRMEAAFRSAGILLPGMSMVPAAKSWAMSLDAYGNPPRGLVNQLISYFNAFSEVGYRANMTDKRRKKIANKGRTETGYKTIRGVVYFVARRRGNQHLHPGIWAKRGIHGSDVAPVFLFVRTGRYRKFIDMPRIAARTVSRVWGKNLREAMSRQA